MHRKPSRSILCVVVVPQKLSVVRNALHRFLSGTPAEFTDLKFVARGSGHEVTRVKASGNAVVQFNIITKVSNRIAI